MQVKWWWFISDFGSLRGWQIANRIVYRSPRSSPRNVLIEFL